MDRRLLEPPLGGGPRPLASPALLRAILIAVLASLALVACGDDHEPSAGAPVAPAPQTAPSPASAADRAVARRALLVRSDLPRGWTPAQRNAPTLSSCPAVKAARAAVSARAASPDYRHDPTGQVSHTVYVYRDDRQAESDFGSLTSAATRRCVGEEIRARIAKEAADVEVGDVRTSALEIDPVGEQSAAARVELDYGTAAARYTLTADLVFVRDGRGLAFLVLADETGTFDERLAARLATVADRRLRAAL